MTTEYVRLVTDTGIIRMFPNANRPATPIRSALNVLGHFSLLLLAVAVVGLTTVCSVLALHTALASGPAVAGAYSLLVFVGVGVVKTSYRFAGYGAAFVGGLAIVMALGQHAFGDVLYPGTVYLGLATVIALVCAVVRLEVWTWGR
jgi:hypothetical protein